MVYADDIFPNDMNKIVAILRHGDIIEDIALKQIQIDPAMSPGLED